MDISEEHVVKVPIDEIRRLVKTQLGIDIESSEPELIGDYLVFKISRESVRLNSSKEPNSRQRRHRKRRNRVKTRGWKVVSSISLPNGMKSKIYEPFVIALKDDQLSRYAQKKVVKDIIIANGNSSPTEGSIDYFLENTLAYLKSMRQSDGNGKK